jgi:hypothetical protein
VYDGIKIPIINQFLKRWKPFSKTCLINMNWQCHNNKISKFQKIWYNRILGLWYTNNSFTIILIIGLYINYRGPEENGKSYFNDMDTSIMLFVVQLIVIIIFVFKMDILNMMLYNRIYISYRRTMGFNKLVLQFLLLMKHTVLMKMTPNSK